METHKIKYDLVKFPFRKIIENHFGINDLEHLHANFDHVPFFHDKTYDQSTDIHRKFYELYESSSSEFLSIYENFLREIILPKYNERLVYQAKPTFRVHLPNNVAVGEWHKDGDYNHQRSEINYWLPFTNAFGNNTIWIETQEDLGDFAPYEVNHGEVLVFNGACLTHGNKPNNTGVCRVSMDFRVVPFSQYNELQVCSSHVKLQFRIGGYYKLLEP